ncbi:MAG: DUF5818 domain-containing protein [Acidobacteria bacterium]|jgi:hypothetical protein|nr:DUF5818 domain-containing protein [Acidobacteriota bacterium]
MRINYRNLFLALALGAFTFAATPGWAGMTPAFQAQTTPGAQSYQSQMGNKAQSRVQSVTGTIVKSGGQFVLEASNGQEYQLSNASRAKSYVGKTVTVTGKVNASSHTISVQSIQPQ